MSTYYARHREEMLAQQKEYRAKHREAYLEYFQRYYQEKLKAKRNLERQHNATRWNAPPVKFEARKNPKRVAAPAPPAPPTKSKRPSRRAVLIHSEPGPIVTRLPGRIVHWS